MNIWAMSFGNLNSHRGKVRDLEERGGAKLVLSTWTEILVCFE
jgi:hypothetical protein